MARPTIAQLFDLTGKGAIVTGGAMGIGQAIAFRLAEAGAGVMIADIAGEAAGETVEQIAASGGRAQAIRADVTTPDDAEAAVRACVDAFGSLDILVNDAGIYPHSSVLEISADEWDRVLDVNVRGVYNCSQAAAREMLRIGRGGKIVNVSSGAGLHPAEDRAAYCTSKASLNMLTQAMALELAPYNILVNAVVPGGVMTPGGAALAVDLQAKGVSLQEVAETFIARVLLGRLAEPDDIARVVLFLASGASDYMTGSIVVADGGRQVS
jgi:2-deoxy-D-gluconate 3-dehydrogenase